MHSRLVDLARYGECADAATEPRDDRRHVSALVWLVPLVAFWVIVGAAVM